MKTTISVDESTTIKTTLLNVRTQRPATKTIDLPQAARDYLVKGMNAIWADVFAIYLKARIFQRNLTTLHAREYHHMLDKHADQLLAMATPIADCVSTLGSSTPRSIGQISRLQRIRDIDTDYVELTDMLAEVRNDHQALAASLREMHYIFSKHNDAINADMIAAWIDATERRIWHLPQHSQHGGRRKY